MVKVGDVVAILAGAGAGWIARVVYIPGSEASQVVWSDHTVVQVEFEGDYYGSAMQVFGAPRRSYYFMHLKPIASGQGKPHLAWPRRKVVPRRLP